MLPTFNWRNPSKPPLCSMEFTCDVCGQPGVKTTRNQKRHLRCQAKAQQKAKRRSVERIKRGLRKSTQR